MTCLTYECNRRNIPHSRYGRLRKGETGSPDPEAWGGAEWYVSTEWKQKRNWNLKTELWCKLDFTRAYKCDIHARQCSSMGVRIPHDLQGKNKETNMGWSPLTVSASIINTCTTKSNMEASNLFVTGHLILSVNFKYMHYPVGHHSFP